MIPIRVYKENEETETIKAYSDFLYEQKNESVQKSFEPKSLDLDFDEFLNRRSCYYDIKIRNEHNELIDYKLVNSSSKNHLKSKTESLAAYEIKRSYNAKQFGLIQSASSLSSSSLVLSSSSFSEKRHYQRSSESIFISKEDSEYVSSIESSSSNESSYSSLNAISHEQVELNNHSTANSSALKVEYVPTGKIITINVSIMW